METKNNDATAQRPQGARVLDAPLVGINITEFMKQIKTETAWETSDRNAISVYKTNGMRIVLIALHKDAVLKKHTAGGIISVQVLEGEINFSTDDESIVLSLGNMIALHKGLPHSVHAIKESVFLLTLTTSLDK
ncbi:cupin domain-containing protein [Ferruginibacter sp.]|uniref:cupin domain-containing protein n=1 Tax=Ferruginibacter sp. TaxID=1940288 RepID=UPI0019B92520|nr:cupin domain-containing protein [Ferruginibacter sp.]MBC7625968.1 cupin domain-containing protein [Ferruginibacter sp.]